MKNVIVHQIENKNFKSIKPIYEALRGKWTVMTVVSVLVACFLIISATAQEQIIVTCEQENVFDNDGKCCCWCPDPTGAHKWGHVMDLGKVISDVDLYFEIKPGAGDVKCITTGYLYYSLDGSSWILFWSEPNLKGWTTYTDTVHISDYFRYVRANTDSCSVDWCKVECECILQAADRISSICDSHIGKEVTVSGVTIALSNNIEPSTSTEGGIQTYEPGDAGVLTLDDGTDTIFVSSNPGLLEKFYKGQRVTVIGIYAGKGGITEGKGIIYADKVSADIGRGYEDVTVKELEEFPEYYYADSVRIKGNVTRIEVTSGETELTIDDHTGTMDVEYRAEMEDIKIGDAVIVEGKFYRNKIYAFAVKAEKQKPELEETPGPEPRPTPIPSPSPTPTPTNETTPTTSPTPVEEAGMPPYLIVIVIAVAAVAGVFIAFKVRERLMLKRYGK